MILAGRRSSDESQCGCYKCWNERRAALLATMSVAEQLTSNFIVCDVCGNKRCPHATDHAHACTGSNEPGQPGSRYK